MADEVFEGHDGRECGEHRTTGARAWCFGCTEWCYPEQPCKGCELPRLRGEVARLRTALEQIASGILPDGDHVSAPVVLHAAAALAREDGDG